MIQRTPWNSLFNLGRSRTVRRTQFQSTSARRQRSSLSTSRTPTTVRLVEDFDLLTCHTQEKLADPDCLDQFNIRLRTRATIRSQRGPRNWKAMFAFAPTSEY